MHDLANLLAVERLKDDDLVDPVQELGPEQPLELVAIFALRVLALVKGRRHKAQRSTLDRLGTYVARHDHDRVAEVHLAALAVGQAAVVHDLQQRVPHIRVRLLDFVEEDHPVGPAAHLLGQLAALVVAHIARRGAKEAAHRVRLAVLAHVDAQQRLVVVEQEARQRLGQLGLADAGRAKEQEGADGPLRVLQTSCAPGEWHR